MNKILSIVTLFVFTSFLLYPIKAQGLKSNKSLYGKAVKSSEINIDEGSLNSLGESLKDFIGNNTNRNPNPSPPSKLKDALSRIKNQPISLNNNIINQSSVNSRMHVNKKNGTPRFIDKQALKQFKHNFSIGEPVQQRTFKFLDENKVSFKLENPSEEMEVIKEFEDRYGKKHIRLAQQFNGVPLWGHDMVVHFDQNDNIYLVNAGISPTPKNINTEQFNITEDNAIQIAEDDLSQTTEIKVFEESLKEILSYDEQISKRYICL